MANARRDGARQLPPQTADRNAEDSGGPEIAGIRFQSWPGGRDYDHDTFWHRDWMGVVQTASAASWAWALQWPPDDEPETRTDEECGRGGR